MPGDPTDPVAADHFDEGDDVDDDAVGADDEVDHKCDDDEGGEAGAGTALTFCRFCFCKFILLHIIIYTFAVHISGGFCKE